MTFFFLLPLERGRHGQESQRFLAGGATGAEEGDGHAAEEDPDGHSEWSSPGN